MFMYYFSSRGGYINMDVREGYLEGYDLNKYD